MIDDEFGICIKCECECAVVGDISANGITKCYCCNCWKAFYDSKWNYQCEKCEEK